MMLVDRPGIYGIRHQDGTIYVGSSKYPLSRAGHHRWMLDLGEHFNPHLQRAWSLYGSDTFEFVLLEECEESRLLEREEYWISQFEQVYNVYRVPAQRVGGRSYDEIYGAERSEQLRDNLSKNGGFAQQRGKTYEQIHGVEEAARLRQLRSVSSSYSKSEKTKKKSSRTKRQKFRDRTAVELAPHVRSILEAYGYDVDNDENLRETPVRVAKFLAEFRRPGTQPREILRPTFPEDHHELVIVRNVAFVAMCAHHMLIFRGTAHVGYIPNGRVVGLSKIVRLVKHFAHQLTLQERITTQIANSMHKILHAQGVMVVLEAEHGCMRDRGVEDPQSSTVTSAVRGCFRSNDDGCKDEFLRLIDR